MTGPIDEPPTGPRASPRRSRTQVAVTGEHQMGLREVRPAVFFDRDGTLIRDVGYIKEPDLVELVPDAASVVRAFNYALWAAVIVTNQSGIARGLLTEQDYLAVKARVDDLFAERGAYIEAHYHCPHHPDFTGPCECRKPGTHLYELAAAEHALGLAESVWIGDRWRDVAPSLAFGGRGILVPAERTPKDEIARSKEHGIAVVGSLLDAVHRVLHV
ncbi:MAG: HAD-IIIA family hydrolase [Gemmatimonadetes bacterium]|nr:HAD-IIIA family hydrolase [Gemmatimonadota bacterium]MBI3568183.1 HAD-IIIA family hydrolase [Gemmatimonadota bacterium]